MTLDLADLISADYAQFDGAQTVTLRTVAGNSQSCAGATTSPLSTRQLALIGGVATDDDVMSFSLPATNLSTNLPTPGAVITDENGVLWRVLSVDKRTFSTRYLCACVRDRAEISAPYQPLSLSGAAAGGGAADMSWTNPNVAAMSSATLQASLSTSFTSPTSFSPTVGATSAITYQATGLAANTWYFRVRHTNSLGTSPWSDTATVVVT